MSIWKGYGPLLGFHCAPDVYFSFRETANHLVTETTALFNQRKAEYLLPVSELTNLVPLEVRGLTTKKKIRWLLKHNFLPTLRERTIAFVSIAAHKNQDFSTSLTHINEAIRTLNNTLFLQGEHPRAQECSITLALFEDPVIDDHGHTFERAAIEEHLRRNGNRCPMSREPIRTLVANRELFNNIQERRSQPQIPTLPIHSGREIQENPQRAASNLRIAENFINEGEYEGAFDAFRRVFQYTQRSEDYAKFPQLFERQNQPEKASLAYLYLAKRQIQEKKAELATISLQKALQNGMNRDDIALALSAMYLAQNNRLQACVVLRELGQRTLVRDQAKALSYFAKALYCQPEDPGLYEQMASLSNDVTRSHIYILGYLYFFDQCQIAQAERFLSQALKAFPDNPMIYLAKLSRLRNQNDPDQKLTLYRTLAQILRRQNNVAGALTYLSKAARSNLETDLQAHIDVLLKDGQRELAEKVYLGWIRSLLANNSFSHAEKLIHTCISIFGKSITSLESLLLIPSQASVPLLSEWIPQLEGLYTKANDQTNLLKVYRLAHEHRQGFAYSFKLATHLTQNDPSQASRIFYHLLVTSYKEKKIEQVSRCLLQIQQIDSTYSKFPDAEQQMLATAHYVSQTFVQQQETISQLREQLAKTQTHLDQMMQNQQQVHIAAEQAEKMRQEQIEKEKNLELPFGKTMWEKYFGEIDAEPPFPPNMDQILASPCPFSPEKTVGKTHMLVLIPKRCRGEALSLQNLGRLVKYPKQGHAIDISPSTLSYESFIDDAPKPTRNPPSMAIANPEIQQSRWVLLPKEQPSILAALPKNYDRSYWSLSGLESLALWSVKFVVTGKALFSYFVSLNGEESTSRAMGCSSSLSYSIRASNNGVTVGLENTLQRRSQVQSQFSQSQVQLHDCFILRQF